MEIQRTEDGERGKFFIEENDKQIALMTYKKSGANVITINHTEVDSNYRGEGLGRDLVGAGVKYARENNLKIIPTCSYAKKIFEKMPDFQDALAEEN